MKTQDIASGLWDALDVDRKGSLSEEELVKNFQDINPDMNKEHLKECFEKIGSNGRITKEEFHKNFSLFWHEDDSQENPLGTTEPAHSEHLSVSSARFSSMKSNLKPTWKKRNKKNFETKSLRPLAQKTGTTNFPKFKADEADKIFNWIDSDGTGIVTLEETQLALEFYVGASLKEDDFENLKKMMAVQKLKGIPKQMFETILKDVLTRLRRKEARKLSAYENETSMERKTLDDGDDEDPPDPEKLKDARSSSIDEVMEGFAYGMGITNKALQEKLTKEMADKEKLNKRVRELRKSIMIEKKTKQSLLQNISKDHDALQSKNTKLTNANKKLRKHVEDMVEELEKSKMVTLELYDRIQQLEGAQKTLLQQYRDGQTELKSANKELEELRDLNRDLSQKLRGARHNSISSARSLRKQSISQSYKSTELKAQIRALETTVKSLSTENKELKKQVEEMEAREREAQRELGAKGMSAEFWKNMVRRESRQEIQIDLASELAEMGGGKTKSDKKPQEKSLQNLPPMPVISQPLSTSFDTIVGTLTSVPEEIGEEVDISPKGGGGLPINSRAKLLREDQVHDVETTLDIKTGKSELGMEIEKQRQEVAMKRKRKMSKMRKDDLVELVEMKEKTQRDLLSRLKTNEDLLMDARRKLADAEKKLAIAEARQGEGGCFCC